MCSQPNNLNDTNKAIDKVQGSSPAQRAGDGMLIVCHPSAVTEAQVVQRQPGHPLTDKFLLKILRFQSRNHAEKATQKYFGQTLFHALCFSTKSDYKYLAQPSFWPTHQQLRWCQLHSGLAAGAAPLQQPWNSRWIKVRWAEFWTKSLKKPF